MTDECRDGRGPTTRVPVGSAWVVLISAALLTFGATEASFARDCNRFSFPASRAPRFNYNICNYEYITFKILLAKSQELRARPQFSPAPPGGMGGGFNGPRGAIVQFGD